MEYFGFLNVNKPKGMTSHDVVYFVRKMLGIKQVGHSGTLDPLATGVLVVGVGKATRLFEFLEEDKSYIATLKFGYQSETLDTEGELIKIEDYFPDKDDLEKAIKKFVGDIEQIPPKYSAIKVDGKKLCDLARKGQDIKEIKARPIKIKNIEIIEIDENQAKIKVDCSKGTYIRSLVRDIAQELGTTAVMSDLIRTKSGAFCIDNSIELNEYTEFSDLTDNLINPIEILNYKQIEINDDEIKKVKNGVAIDNTQYSQNEILVLKYNDELVSVGQVCGTKILQRKVLV